MAAAHNPARGEKHYAHKLTDDDVRLIRACVEERQRLIADARKLSDKALAEKFGISTMTVWNISSRQDWKHVP